MKTRRLYIACVALLCAACDLELDPAGATFTGGQKDKLAALDPDKLQSDVNGLYAGLIRLESIASWAGTTLHFDFGYPAACMMFDASGMDVASENSGYNWFRREQDFTDRVANGRETYFLWNLFYSHAKTANDIIRAIDPATDDKTLKGYLGQALASRAFDYLHLAQVYQFTYAGNEQALAVPRVTEKTPADSINDNPRETVERLYAFILEDLTRAIDLLDGFDRKGRKECIDQNVAHGLRARAHLLMERWDEAAADAEKAIAGFTPYSTGDVSKPSFNNIAAASWIWGCAITENNDVVQSGIVNFPSHMCSLTGNGYAPAYAGRYINDALWDKIPYTDVRKGWWLDRDMKSPNVDTTWTIVYNGTRYDLATWFEFQAPYLNMKFGPYQDVYNNPVNACDFPLMRVEEMMLVRAEGLGMGSNFAAGQQALVDFVRAYRCPDFLSLASTPRELQDEIWFQRRVELWGEGFSLFDLKRLKKPLHRLGTNFPENVCFDLATEAPILLWLIPESEMNTNKGIQENNPVVPIPTLTP
ncbi:MAG: RagB/SusD family nutrient uptake outer membrane protein [Odoribacteraceae bacterium]|jgi:hypothetical protein|nr:RagB/SusD family nutrient uptake outer membrane protein [Odoribacteraceae bacterium]